MSIARLSRESGVSATTIRYIGKHEKRQRSTLVAISAALGYRHGYLTGVLLGTPGIEAFPRPVSLQCANTGLLNVKLDALSRAVAEISTAVTEITWREENRRRRPRKTGNQPLLHSAKRREAEAAAERLNARNGIGTAREPTRS